MEHFSDLLLQLWSDCHVSCWNLEKKFTSFVGNELLCFIRSTPKIVEFLKANFQNNKTLCDLCEGLLLWAKISPFLVITEIEDVAMCEKKLEDFIDNVKAFYKIGAQSFLTKDKGN